MDPRARPWWWRPVWRTTSAGRIAGCRFERSHDLHRSPGAIGPAPGSAERSGGDDRDRPGVEAVGKLKHEPAGCLRCFAVASLPLVLASTRPILIGPRRLDLTL